MRAAMSIEDDVPTFQFVAQFRDKDFQSVVSADPTYYFWACKQKLMPVPNHPTIAEQRTISCWNRHFRHDILPFVRWVEAHYQVDAANQVLISLRKQKQSTRYLRPGAEHGRDKHGKYHESFGDAHSGYDSFGDVRSGPKDRYTEPPPLKRSGQSDFRAKPPPTKRSGDNQNFC